MIEKLNKAWHLKHRMPPNATFEQRVRWHLEHVEHCACRPIPAKLLKQKTFKGTMTSLGRLTQGHHTER